MLDQKSLADMWDRIRLLHGIALRVIAAVPADKIDSRPVPQMRTPVELVVHLYAMAVRELAEGVARGEIRNVDEAALCARIKTRDDLVAFARENYAAAARAIQSTTDAQIQGPVKSPWGDPTPGWVMLRALHEEFLHHRGQLYAYVRALGAAPPDMYDFENSEAEFRPRQMQKA